MNHFKVGDEVRVLNLSSQWRRLPGTIEQVIDRPMKDNRSVQECAVRFATDLRWFLADHLVTALPLKMIRFFRAEVVERWKLDPQLVNFLDGSREQLTAFLQDHYGFSVTRAGREADEFFRMFDERMRLATQVAPPTGSLHASAA